MRFHDALDDLLGNPVRLRVLRNLARSPTQGFTGRELARLCSASPSQTIHALRSLEDSGVVTREVAGPAHVWRLSSEHVLADPLIGLFKQESQLPRVLKSTLQEVISGLPVHRAAIFGSVARGEELPASDVDFFVEIRSVRDRTLVEDALNAASPKLAIRFGNALSSLVLSEGQVQRPSNPALIRRIFQEADPVAT